MKSFKKIICGAIVFCLMLATCIGVTGCFSKKDKGMSKEEKILRTNAVEVLNYMIADAIRVDALYVGGEDNVDDYITYYPASFNMLKKMLNDESVKLGEYYSIDLISEDNLGKYVSIWSIDLYKTEIVVKSELKIFSRESTNSNYILDKTSKNCFVIEHSKITPITFTSYSVDSENFSSYDYYDLANDNKKIFDVNESVYKDEYDPEHIYFHYNYIEGNNIINLHDETINGVALVYCNKLLSEAKNKTDAISYEKTNTFPQEIQKYFEEWFFGED